DEPDRSPTQRCHGHHHRRHEQGHAGAPHYAAEYVTSEIIGAEEVRAARGLQPIREAVGDRIVRSDHGREESHRQHDEEDDAPRAQAHAPTEPGPHPRVPPYRASEGARPRAARGKRGRASSGSRSHRRTRGSRTAYATSTSTLTMTTLVAKTTTSAWT